MYIIYCRNQTSADLEDKTSYRLSVTGGDYRPTRLVRVSDRKKVPGKAAMNGYHTISYCWEQSGQVAKNEIDDGNNEYSIVDKAKQCIVEEYNLYEDFIVSSTVFPDTSEDDDHDNIQEASDTDTQESNNHSEYVTWCEPKSKAAYIRYVTYDQLLQQVCKNYEVEYVWYDKICIDQSDSEAKSKEIKQMHKIYCNARYTIAMVPEAIIYTPDDINEGSFYVGNIAQEYFGVDVFCLCWWTRSWKLEEVMMAKRILIVGSNANMFQHSLNITGIPTTGDGIFTTLLDFEGTEEKKSSVNRTLVFAHFVLVRSHMTWYMR